MKFKLFAVLLLLCSTVAAKDFTAQALILKDDATVAAEFAAEDSIDARGAAVLRAIQRAGEMAPATVLVNAGEFRAPQWTIPNGVTVQGKGALETRLIGTYAIGGGVSTLCVFELGHESHLRDLTIESQAAGQSMLAGHAPAGNVGNQRRHSRLTNVTGIAQSWGVYSWPGEVQGQTIECTDVLIHAGRQCFTNGSSGARGCNLLLKNCTAIVEPQRYNGGHFVQEGLFGVVARGGLTKLDGCTIRVPSAKDLGTFKMSGSSPTVPVRAEGIATWYGDSSSSGALVVEVSNTRFLVADGPDIGWDAGTIRDLGGNRGSGVRMAGKKLEVK